jgi:hypothetical protein
MSSLLTLHKHLLEPAVLLYICSKKMLGEFKNKKANKNCLSKTREIDPVTKKNNPTKKENRFQLLK